MLTSKILRGASILTLGQAIVATCSFARNIVVARLISVEDFGIAALFAAVISVAETLSYMGLDKYLVQSEDGDTKIVQSAAHLFTIIRGFVAFLLILFFSGMFARIFDLADLAYAFACLSVVPLVRGFVHLDVVRLQRDLEFKPIVWTDSIPQIAAVTFAAPLAIWLKDYRVMLWIVIGQATLYTFVSHLVARRPYRIAFELGPMKDIFQFGWPLLINALFIFGVFHGDKAIIGAMLTKQELGWYSAVFSLLLTPTMLAVTVFGSALLPSLSRAALHKNEFQVQFRTTIQTSLILATGYAAFLSIGGPSILLFFFGDKYAPSLIIFLWVVFAMTTRMLRAGIATVAISLADTRNLMYSNAIRLTALPLAALSISLGYGLQGVAASALVGELLALLTSVALLYRYRSLTFAFIGKSFLLASIVLGLTALILSQHSPGSTPVRELFAGTLISLSLMGAIVWLSPELKSAAKQILGRSLD